MMSKTHITVGIATSLAVMQPNSFKGCCLAIIGGSIGGVIADNDILDNDHTSDAILGEAIAGGVSAAIILLDNFFNKSRLLNFQFEKTFVPGLILFCILYVLGFISDHRGKTHSLLFALLYSTSMYMIYKPVTYYFLFGYLSHLALDFLNKKGIQLFFPWNKRFCLSLVYADGETNNIFMYGGLIASFILLIYLIFIKWSGTFIWLA